MKKTSLCVTNYLQVSDLYEARVLGMHCFLAIFSHTYTMYGVRRNEQQCRTSYGWLFVFLVSGFCRETFKIKVCTPQDSLVLQAEMVACPNGYILDAALSAYSMSRFLPVQCGVGCRWGSVLLDCSSVWLQVVLKSVSFGWGRVSGITFYARSHRVVILILYDRAGLWPHQDSASWAKRLRNDGKNPSGWKFCFQRFMKVSYMLFILDLPRY